MTQQPPGSVSERLEDSDPGTTLRLPGFAPIPQLPGPAHPDPPQIPGPAPAETPPGPGQPPGPGPADHDGPGPTPGSTPDSGRPAPPPAPFRARVRAFTKLAEHGFAAVAGLLNKAAMTEQAPDVFLPDDDDMATVPPPIARLAARRVELPMDEDQLTDAQDMISAAIALGAWGLKGLVEYLSARRAARRTLQGKAIHVQGDDQQ